MVITIQRNRRKSNGITQKLCSDYDCNGNYLFPVSDFEYEFQMALTNKKLNPDCETVFLTTSAENMYLSSSIVKQVAQFGGDISDFVPVQVLSDIERRLTHKDPQ